jgi:hypothetical protein
LNGCNVGITVGKITEFTNNMGSGGTTYTSGFTIIAVGVQKLEIFCSNFRECSFSITDGRGKCSV